MVMYLLQKGTIVEKLVEEVVKDSQHLKHLIGVREGIFAGTLLSLLLDF